MSRWLGIAILSAVVFALLAGWRLADPGLYYDEIHQVPAALTWLGEQPGSFSLAPIGGLPLMTMTYSGALKSALFAGVLYLTDAPFSVGLWRAFGVVIVLAGWIWCCAAMGRRWGAIAELAFAALLLTDMTVLLTTRHDWGPTALALCLRFAFLAIWIHREAISVPSALALGAIAGLAIYEKLSSSVLLAALAVALAGLSRRHVRAALIGLGLGLMPLFLANLATAVRGEGLISLARLTDARPETWWGFARDYLSLGAGDWTRQWVLDLPAARWSVAAEGVLMLTLVGLACLRAESRRAAAVFLVIGVLLFLLPRRTQAHHWILGTPFQYVAIAILISRPSIWQPPARVLLVALLCLRIPGVVETASAIADGRAAPRFDRASTQLAERLAAAPDALIVAATWGIGNQIRSFSRGRDTALLEPIYSDAQVDTLERALADTPRRTLYVVEVPAAAGIFLERTERVRKAIETHPRWRSVPVPDALRTARTVHVEQFVR